MAKLGVLMLTLVVTAIAGKSWAAVSDQSHNSMEKEPINGRNSNNNQDKAIELLAINRDDDHSNLDLDKLMNDAYRYEILPAGNGGWMPNEGDAYSLTRLFAKMNRNRMNELVGSKQQVKRSNLKAREDKDYSFVSQPLLISGIMGRAYGGNGGYDSPASKWAAQKLLRDMMLSNRPSNGYEQLRPYSSAVYNSYDGVSNEIMPTNREKRRRCRADPNLGVKNPSFCDTDAYFGAADYSMRDVWDSAGR